MDNEVVITNIGILSPIGKNEREFEENLFAGRSGVRSIRGTLAPPDFPVPYGAWISRDELPESVLFKDRDRAGVLKSWLMTEQIAFQALRDVDPRHSLDAIVYGTADGVSYDLVEKLLKKELSTDFDVDETASEGSLKIIQQVMKHLRFESIEERNVVSLNSACATGNQTIGIAYQGIRSGRWRRVFVGGVDARCEPSNFLNFNMLGALTTDEVPPEKASRPFSKDRSGFVRGEGAASLILESREAAEERGAKILAVVSGYGCTSDAYRLTDGREDGQSVIEAMRSAIETAGLSADQIDYVNAHGTSTPLNDRLETLAIKEVFGDRYKRLPVSSLKSQIGHSTIASSSIEAIACALMLRRQRIAPTINYHHPDPECDLDVVPNESRPAPLKHVLSNSLGFGGQNTCVVFGKGNT